MANADRAGTGADDGGEDGIPAPAVESNPAGREGDDDDRFLFWGINELYTAP